MKFADDDIFPFNMQSFSHSHHIILCDCCHVVQRFETYIQMFDEYRIVHRFETYIQMFDEYRIVHRFETYIQMFDDVIYFIDLKHMFKCLTNAL